MTWTKTEQRLRQVIAEVASALFGDFSSLLGINLDKDLEVFIRRLNSEGSSFATKTVPRLWKHLLLCLDAGSYDRPSVLPFKVRKTDGCPLFFQEVTSMIFDFGNGGVVRSDVDALPVKVWHQLADLFRKIEIDLSDSLLDAAVQKYVAQEDSYPDFWDSLDDVNWKIIDNARQVLHQVFGEEDLLEILPRHGPGAVSAGEKYGEKFIFFRDDRLNAVYPLREYFSTSGVYLQGEELSWDMVFHHYSVAERQKLDCLDSVGPSKMYLVPKDVEKPRIIQAEPKEKQFIQGGQGVRLRSILESHPLTRGHVNFHSQEVNRRLALRGSRDGKIATIDWSDASDLIGNDLVRFLFPSKMVRALMASRSPAVTLPDGRVIRLRKFAGMGSAVCFPIESAVFYAISVGVIAQRTGWEFDRCAKLVYVYGDDVIVPSKWAEPIMQFGLAIGMKPSQKKCFYRSLHRPSFRESCGMDAFGGEDITPVRLKHLPPERVAQVDTLISYISLSNNFFVRGYWKTSDLLLKKYVYPLTGRRIPIVPGDSGQIGLLSFSHKGYFFPEGTKIRWNSKLQRLEYLGIKPKTVKVRDSVSMTEFLLRNLAGFTPSGEFVKTPFRELSSGSSVGTSDLRSKRKCTALGFGYKPILA